MPKRRLFWQLYPALVLITALALAGAGWYAAGSLRAFHQEQVTNELRAGGRMLADRVAATLATTDYAATAALCRETRSQSATRVTVILPDGRVVADSDEAPAGMDNHAARPEVAAALKGEIGVGFRRSATLRQDMLYVAQPLRVGGRLVGVIRTSLSLSQFEAPLRRLYLHLALGGLVIAVLAAGVSLLAYRRIGQPLAALRHGAERFARGDLGHHLEVPDSEEIGSLAEAMNAMAAQLDERIRTVVQQRNEQEAVLSSMVEGVVAVDREGRVLSLNEAGARMLRTTWAEAHGKCLPEVTRNPALQELVGRALAAAGPLEQDLVLREADQERFLQAHGSALLDAQGERVGVVVVLNDVTRLRRLENLRREFVANVSHELKTPITSIKGFVETLQEGGLADPAAAARFLAIVARHADRLNTIIEDLLLLARIEQDAERTTLELRPVPLAEILHAAWEVCAVRAGEKNITVALDCAADLVVRVNPPLFEQAVANLVDNAIKYSAPGSPVRLAGSRADGGVTIAVQDQGCGISQEHLPRLGERFYRVDQARSRQQGGTGLGLAIVKHIAQAHGGGLSVQSTPGVGSTFTIRLPEPAPPAPA